MLKLVRGVTFFWLLALGVTSFLVLLTPSIVLMLVPLSPVVSLRRWYGDLLVGLFLDYSAVGLLMLGGTKVSLYTNEKEILNDKGTLLLCNHRTRVDWMYAGWVYNMMCRNNKTLRFIMKDELRAVPVFGWVMQIVMCIFLNRKNKERDLMELTQKAKYLQSSGARPSVFLFPEGTDLSPESVAKAHVFAKERQLPLLDYVLYPKVAGMCALLHAMKGNGGAVHDITIAYEDHVKGQRTNEKSIFSGQYPKHIHLCVRRFELDDLPSDKHMAERWLKGSFLKKERLLKSFYESDHVVPQDRSSGNKERGHGKKSMTCGQGVAFQSAHRPESTLYSTYGPRAGLDCALTWTLAEGLLLEKAAGSLMTLAEKEGLLAADFREAVDIRTSPSARVEERAANSDAQPAQHGKCIDLSSHSVSSDEALTCTDRSDFEADVLSYRFKEEVIESSVIKGMADFYPPLLLGRIYRDME